MSLASHLFQFDLLTVCCPTYANILERAEFSRKTNRLNDTVGIEQFFVENISKLIQLHQIICQLLDHFTDFRNYVINTI